jgi:hypothetical protein
MRERAMRKVLRGYAKDKDGNLILIGTMPVPFSKDKCPPASLEIDEKLEFGRLNRGTPPMTIEARRW